MRSRKYQSVIPHQDSAPDHTRPGTVNRVGDHVSPREAKAPRNGEAVSKNLEKWQDWQLLRHLGGSCGLRARLLRCLDGPKQQRSAMHTYGLALGQQ